MARSFPMMVLLAVVVWPTNRGLMSADPMPKPKPPGVEKVRKRLFKTCWYETGKVIAGKEDPNGPLGWKFGADEVENWQITGELVTYRMFGGATIDVSQDVWRMDILSKDEKGRTSVLPTIFKFEGETLVWVSEFPGEGWYQQVAPDGNYKGRPSGFKSTEQNRYAVFRLKPCDYLQTTPPQ